MSKVEQKRSIVRSVWMPLKVQACNGSRAIYRRSNSLSFNVERIHWTQLLVVLKDFVNGLLIFIPYLVAMNSKAASEFE